MKAKKKLVILVCGDRKWKNRKRIGQQLIKRKKKIGLLIEGGAKGADEIAWDYARLLGIPTATFEANWEQHGKAAGPIRNMAMLQYGKPDLVLAFHKKLVKSKGTKHCVEQARKLGIKVKVFK